MRVLAGGWHSDGARPIVVQMAHFVRQPLALVGCHTAVVVDDDVVSWGYGTLVDLLRDDQEVVPGGENI